jgi:hypothetical protein
MEQLLADRFFHNYQVGLSKGSNRLTVCLELILLLAIASQYSSSILMCSMKYNKLYLLWALELKKKKKKKVSKDIKRPL